MSNTDERTNYLAQASQYLATYSPKISAHLALSSTNLLYASTLRPASVLPRCEACGSTNIVPKTINIAHRSRAVRRAGTSPSKHPKLSPKSLVYRCGFCLRTKTTRLPCVRSRNKKDHDGNLMQVTPQTANPPTTEPTAELPLSDIKPTSKKRAKARKERAGLQALLDKSKQASGQTRNLSLMDFMSAT